MQRKTNVENCGNVVNVVKFGLGIKTTWLGVGKHHKKMQKNVLFICHLVIPDCCVDVISIKTGSR